MFQKWNQVEEPEHPRAETSEFQGWGWFKTLLVYLKPNGWNTSVFPHHLQTYIIITEDLHFSFWVQDRWWDVRDFVEMHRFHSTLATPSNRFRLSSAAVLKRTFSHGSACDVCLGSLPCKWGTRCHLWEVLLFSTQHYILDPFPSLGELSNSLLWQLKPQTWKAPWACQLPDIWQLCQELNNNALLYLICFP